MDSCTAEFIWVSSWINTILREAGNKKKTKKTKEGNYRGNCDKQKGDTTTKQFDKHEEWDGETGTGMKRQKDRGTNKSDDKSSV